MGGLPAGHVTSVYGHRVIRKAWTNYQSLWMKTYKRTLQEIPREKKEYTHRLFQCLISAIRPLRAEELGKYSHINFDTNATPNLVEGGVPNTQKRKSLVHVRH